MNSIRLRALTPADLPFADSLRQREGWNQTAADWERFIALEPDGCFLAEWNGAPAGTATTLTYGTALAWIGMILVHSEYRRRGLGRALLQHCLEHLQARGVRCIKLDATPIGKTVYETLDFKTEWTLTRWQLGGLNELGGTDNPRVPSGESPDGTGQRPVPITEEGQRTGLMRNLKNADLDSIEHFDSAAFGASRRSLIKLLAKESQDALVLESTPGRIAGYGLLRNDSPALYLGPVVALSAVIAVQLLARLVARNSGRKIFCDIPDANLAAVAWAKEQGFTPQRPFTRMFLGAKPLTCDAQMQFAIAGPEVG